MKANLPQNEPKLLEFWEKLEIYQRIRQARQGAPQYVLHDGPPYANGPIHLGHALNKCLKDFVVKSKNMAGFDAPYVPGWDCHGLPIEKKVDESLGKKKLELDPAQVRAECRTYAQKYVDLQASQFKRIGVFGDFEHPYLTMLPHYESVVARLFYDFFEKGMVYKGLKPVYWCINDATALAEAEVEYANHTSPSIWVKYRLTSDPGKIAPELAGRDNVNTIIWTTTPWTLPASMAVAFNPDEQYVAFQDTETGAIYIVADKLAEQVRKDIGLAEQPFTPLARFPGRQLELAEFAHPFLDRKILGVLAEYVTMDQGTGAVHTAPAHGADDFYTGVKYGIDQTCNVDAYGRLRNGLPEYDGKTVFQANPNIVELLKSRGVLLGYANIEHSYPHCWRCHKPVIFRATEQWFIGMEAMLDTQTLRQRALEEIKKIKWDPAWGEERIANMVATRPDWCISRQRVWGVPIAVFFCEKCDEVLNDKAINRSVVKLFDEQGADSWYRLSASELLPAGTKCPKCGGSDFRKEMDIIDVWFESGSSHAAVIGREPVDLYLEGGDQYRGWFHSSLLCELGATDQSPYRMVATSGWTLDPKGQPMSKSLGNVVDPVDIANRLGGEIVRLWVASVDFREDVRASEDLMKRVADNYRDLRNKLFKYALSNLFDFDPQRDAVPLDELEPLDRYMLAQTAGVIREMRQWYEAFQFHRIYQRIIQFVNADLSNVYFDVLKDRLYTSAPADPRRRSAQTAVWHIVEALTRMLAPIMTFTCEEVWRHLPNVDNREPSVHLAKFPDPEQVSPPVSDIQSDWDTLLSFRTEVMKALEDARSRKVIGSGLEAQVIISAPEPLIAVLRKYEQELRYLFIVSQVHLEKAQGENGNAAVQIDVRHADGEKCERCWNYSTEVGKDTEYPTVCERCSAVLHRLEATAR